MCLAEADIMSVVVSLLPLAEAKLDKIAAIVILVSIGFSPTSEPATLAVTKASYVASPFNRIPLWSRSLVM